MPVMAGDGITVTIANEGDIVTARQRGRAMSEQVGFQGSDLTIIATAISEIARNIVTYAKRGEIVLGPIIANGTRGVMVVARDDGPGIPDIARAMQDGYSTGRTLGLGLPGARRLMDEFEVQSEVGVGTIVTMRKWLRR
jgi:serine/threonine-protein kinase RsbT